MRQTEDLLQTKKGFRFNISDPIFALLMILPAVAVLATVVFLPILKGIFVSFCEYKIANINSPVWNNFENYRNIFKNAEVLIYFKNTLIYVFLAVSIQLVLGLSIAMLLNTNIKGRGLYRGLFLIPWTIPSVVVAIVWRWMLQQQFGVLNYLFYQFGLTSSINISWTQTPSLAMAAVVMAAVWRQMPYMMVMVLAALQSVDGSLIEASKIDGANSWKVFSKITIPCIRPVLAISIWISIMNNFQMFTIVYNMTGGGPLNSTTTLGIAAYKRAFMEYNFGEGSAIGVIWLTALFIATIIFNKVNDKYSADCN